MLDRNESTGYQHRGRCSWSWLRSSPGRPICNVRFLFNSNRAYIEPHRDGVQHLHVYSIFSFRSLASTILGTESFNPRRWTRLHEGWVFSVRTYFSVRMGFITALLVGAFGFGIQVGHIWHAYRRRLMRDLYHVQLVYYSDRNIRDILQSRQLASLSLVESAQS